MIQFFLSIYQFFDKHKLLLYGLLVLIITGVIYFAIQIRPVEDINSFMPKTEDSKKIGEVFRNLKIKDKVIILISSADTSQSPDPERLAFICDEFLDALQTSNTGKTHIKSIQSKVNNNMIDQMYNYITGNLPVFLDTADYKRLDTLLTGENLEKRVQQNYENLLTPLSLVTKKMIVSDPLGLSGKQLKDLDALQLSLKYDIYDDHIFSIDHQYLLAFISPQFGAGEISRNEVFVKEIETLIQQFREEYPDVTVSYFGGIPISVYNARQIKADSLITMIIALTLISIVVLVAFKRKSAIPLIILPVLFGGAFSLAVISLMQGSISTIAIGAGSVILGVALSYSIHVFCHSLHTKSAEQVIRELAYPMTIGSFTTIGAFVGLTFCNSDILKDLGLFACFTLIGTTLFCLIFLPHFLIFKSAKNSRLMNLIEKINAYPYEKNKYLVVFLVLITGVCLFFFNDVKFNGDMMQLSYMPDQFAKAENTLNNTFQDEFKSVYFVSVGDQVSETLENYKKTDQILDKLKDQGMIKEYSSAHNLLIPPNIQQKRIALWNQYWTPEKKQKLKADLVKAGGKYKFKESSFNRFFEILDKEYTIIDYQSQSFSNNNVLSEWIDCSDKLKMAITQVRLTDQNKEDVYNTFNNISNIVILDKPYFASKMAGVVNDDFNTILYIVSILVFVSIFISYGRIEITLITFLPMAVSWVIILGFMALLNIQFNIISIIISTFIFGIGDDFSIFIMDGLLSEYKNGKKMLNAHKTAIFFSAFTIIAGLGAMMFSRHPALYSISVTSIIGMISVVLVAYSIQPFIFRLFISARTSRGKFPYTWYSLTITVIALSIFTTGSLILSILSYLFILVPISEKRKQAVFHYLIHYFIRFLLWIMINEKKVYRNSSGEDFSRPAIIIANHQSVIDILRMLAIHNKIIMLTKSWVVSSFIFGRVARYAGFIDITKGYEQSEKQIQEKMNEGYSIGIFPEGSRSGNCRLKRFHKGAFYLAEKLKADIIPVIFHGNGQAISKDDPFYLKDTIIATKILQRIPSGKMEEFGDSYQERAKAISRMFRKEHALFAKELDVTINPFFRYKLIKNYTYKGPVLEWYLRIKIAMENDYKRFEKLIPQTATITDIGCGYGFLAYMLAFRSDERLITGIDYDEEKITLANYNFSKTDRLNFITADASETEFMNSDIFVLNDVLHYLPGEKQNQILKQCIRKLNKNGKIIIRDGDREKRKKHLLTQLSEIFSTKIMKFNKREHELCFISTEEIKNFARENDLSVLIEDNDQYSSNTLYIIEKRGNEYDSI